jgi:hypothetical protein
LALRRELLAHEVEAVVQLGWTGIENGALLKKAIEARFELLVTMDGSMAHQQKHRWPRDCDHRAQGK